MASSSPPPPPPQTDTCLNFITHLLKAVKEATMKVFFLFFTCFNFITHLLKALKEVMMNVFSHDEKPEKLEQLSQALSQASASSSSSRRLKHQVFLSFRGEDTRLNFTAHLLKALKDKGLNVYFDEEALEKGEQLPQALSRAISASILSLIILSVDYASSKPCLAELADIMHCKDTQGHIVLPIFYHVDPSDVRNLGGSFETSFDEHESNRLHQVQEWKAAFAKVGKLKGWHIGGGKFDRPETEYIKDIVEYVTKKLMSTQFRSASEELVEINDKKKTILRLIEEDDNHLIGLCGWGETPFTILAPPIFNRKDYHIWAARMKTHLEANDLWEAVEEDYEIPPLSANPTMMQLKNHKEKKTRKPNARAMLFTANSAFEVWNFLKEEYEGDEMIKGMCILNLIREFELQKMKDSETVKEYFDRLLSIAKKVRLLL